MFIFIHSRINSKSQRTPTAFGLSVVSLANLHKRSEALARYYVTLHWQAEWAKKRRWKKIESPSPPSPPSTLLRQYVFVEFLFALFFYEWHAFVLDRWIDT